MEDPSKVQLMEKVEADLNKIIDDSGIDYFEKAMQGRSYLNKLVIMRYLEGIIAVFSSFLFFINIYFVRFFELIIMLIAHCCVVE